MLLREIFVPPPAWHCRGVGMPRCAEFYTQKPARRKASPGGEAGSSQELTDEVEAIVHHHESVQNCYLRPHPSRFWRDTFSPGRRLWSVQTGNPYRPSSVTGQGPCHLPPGEGSPQKGRQPSTKSNRTPPPSPSVTPPPTRREAAPRRFLRIEFRRAGHQGSVSPEHPCLSQLSFRPNSRLSSFCL